MNETGKKKVIRQKVEHGALGFGAYRRREKDIAISRCTAYSRAAKERYRDAGRQGHEVRGRPG